MANAYTSPITYSPTISTMDIAQLTGQVQTALQQRFDINVAKVDDLIQKITTVPLVRDKDKKYLGDRLGSLLSMVDANSKVDMTNNNVTRQISNYISTAIDDNVKEQVSNSQKIQSFQQEAARIKKEKPDMYNDANYAYALDKSGYADYVNEKTDSIGNLQYTPYYDVTKNLNEPLEKWAKERGFERIFDSSVQGGYIYQTIKGKRVSPEEIESFVNNRVQSDPKLKQQLMINSHYKYRGVSDEELLKDYQEKAKPILDRYDVTISSIDTEIKNTNPDNSERLKKLNDKKAYTSQQREFFESQIDPKNFNRDSFLYKNETQNLVESYKKTFSYSAETDIENDNFYKSVKGAGKGTGTGDGAAQGLPAGTAFTRAEEKVEEKDKKSPFKIHQEDKTSAFKEFEQIVRQKLEKEGKGFTNNDVAIYYTNLKKAFEKGVDINAQGFSPELIESYKKVEYHNKVAYSLQKTANEVYGKTVNETLEGLFGGKSKDLNVSGLSTTMPYTAELLKKYKSASQLTAKEKAMAKYEIGKNIKEYLLNDDEDKQKFDFYLQGIKKDNKISDKELEKYNREEPGFFESGWDAIAGTAQGAWGALTGGARAKINNTNYSKYADESRQGFARAFKGILGQAAFLGRAFVSDADLSEIEDNDIVGGDVSERVTRNISSLSTRFDKILKDNEASLPKTMSVVLNSQNKNDEPYVEAIKSALYSEGKNPAKDTNIVIKDIKNGIATVTFDNEILTPKDKGGQTKEIVRDDVQIPISNLPSNLMNSIQTNSTDWANSYKNPQEMKVLLHYKPFFDLDSRYEFSKKYLENYGGTISQPTVELIQKTNFAEFKTKDELIGLASKYLPKEYLQDYSTNILDANYSVNWNRKAGAFYPTLMKNGKSVLALSGKAIDYKTHDFNIATMEIINKYLEDQIVERRKEILQTQIR